MPTKKRIMQAVAVSAFIAFVASSERGKAAFRLGEKVAKYLLTPRNSISNWPTDNKDTLPLVEKRIAAEIALLDEQIHLIEELNQLVADHPSAVPIDDVRLAVESVLTKIRFSLERLASEDRTAFPCSLGNGDARQ